MQFFDGVNSLGTAAVSGGTASLATSTLSVGSHSITATYSGPAKGMPTLSINDSMEVTQQ